MSQNSQDELPIAIFYGGTNGSGKSTLRAAYDDQYIDIHIDPDQIARKINPSNPRSVDVAAGKEAIRVFNDALANKSSLTMESTLTGKSILNRIEKASSLGYMTELRYVGLASADLNVERVRQRVAKGGHSIDEDVIRRRYQESRDNLVKAASIAHRIEIWDNSGDQACIIGTVIDGEIETNPDVEIPKWIHAVISDISAANRAQSPYSLTKTDLDKSNSIFDKIGKSNELDNDITPSK